MEGGNGKTDESLIRLIGELRATNPQLLNPRASDDQLGIFIEGKRDLNNHMMTFLGKTLESVLTLERDTLMSADKSSPATEGLISLTSVLSRVLYYSKDPSQRKGQLYIQDKNQKVIPRYDLVSKTALYLPDIPEIHNKEIFPSNAYDFSTPAIVTIKVIDNLKKQALLFTLRPVPYSFFRRKKELAGVAPSEGEEILHEKVRDLRRSEDIKEIVSGAQATYLPQGFGISLLEDEKVVSSVQGDFSVGNNGNAPGFVMYASDFPDRTIFQQLNPSGKNGGVKQMGPVAYMRPIVEGFLNLSIKKS